MINCHPDHTRTMQTATTACIGLLAAGARGAAAQQAPLEWTAMFQPYGDAYGEDMGPDYYPYSLEDPKRQHIHVLQAPMKSPDQPTGVLLYAHGNGGDAAPTNMEHFRPVVDSGYSVISWESVSELTPDPATLQVCQSDLLLVFDWLRANAAQYHLDLGNVIMGGRSRGSICSWVAAHSQHSDVKIVGLYMNNV